MDRRLLISSGLAAVGAGALSSAARAQLTGGAEPAPHYAPAAPSTPPPPMDNYPPPPQPPASPNYAPQQPAYATAPPPPSGAEPMRAPEGGPTYQAETYSTDELFNKVSNFFGVTAEKAGAVIERLFRDNGRPTGYIAGQEGAGAFGVGLRYGDGLLYMKHRANLPVFWQGPSIGWDVGGNASRVFTLCYNLQYPDMIYRRFPGVEGSAYFIGGLGVNYQRADDITLAPVRAGLGLRLGANVGYLSYSRRRRLIPL